jgi:ubiquinone/menaquinone biosynthesis C-methylase UbiE
MIATNIDRPALEDKVKKMYTAVAQNPAGPFHFEMGRAMAERLGYDRTELDRVPSEAIDSFAGVGHFFHLADLTAGEHVVDLGSGSGMDTFVASLKVGPTGHIVGIDMTDAQLSKSDGLARAGGFTNVEYRKAYIEETGLPTGAFDCVISNGVINLASDKPAVFAEAGRLLKRGGRLAIADIVTDVRLPENVVCNVDLWAACIGGAAQRDDYAAAITAGGLVIERIEDNPQYQFLSKSARGATDKWGVKSVSILARKLRLSGRRDPASRLACKESPRDFQSVHLFRHWLRSVSVRVWIARQVCRRGSPVGRCAQLSGICGLQGHADHSRHRYACPRRPSIGRARTGGPDGRPILPARIRRSRVRVYTPP